MEKEFNLSEKIFGIRQGFVAYEEEIKEFIKRVKIEFYRPSTNWDNFEEIIDKLAGDKLT